MSFGHHHQLPFSGSFITNVTSVADKLRTIKALVFDWDGVFNDGSKSVEGNSGFSEIDSMGINLLRFHQTLLTGVQPIAIIITGENNKAAFNFARREHFQSVYFKIKHKETALNHLCKTFDLQPQEVLFVFDDVLDFSASKIAGIRLMVNRSCNPLLINFAVENKLVDYITQHNGSNGAIREVSELMMFLSGLFESTIQHRMQYSDTYKTYIEQRDQILTNFYSIVSGEIIAQEINE